jgi:hypothetical protein
MELISSIVQFDNILVKSQKPSFFFRKPSIIFGDGKKSDKHQSVSDGVCVTVVTIFEQVPLHEGLWVSGG